MTGTAIQSQIFGLPARARRLRVERGGLRSRAWSQQIAAGVSKIVGNRRWLTALFLMMFVIGSVSGPAAHPWSDGDPAETAQPLVVKASAATDAPAKRDMPGKGLAGGMCTGHCMSHSVSLPAPIMANAMAPYIARAAWQVVNDQRFDASTPSRLERPPRV